MAHTIKGNYKYNFSNPSDEETLLREWGGKSVVRDKYPAVWAAIERTKEYEKEAEKNGEGVNGYVIAGAPNLVSDKKNAGSNSKNGLSALLQMRLEDGKYVSNPTNESKGYDIKPKPWPYAMLSGNIRNVTDSINVAFYGREHTQTNAVDVELASDKIYDDINFAKKRVETYCSFSATDFNDVLHNETYSVVNPTYSDEEGSSLVRNFTVSAPYSSYGNVPIKMLYDREPSESEKGIIDYTYKDVRNNAIVKTCLPIKAELEFADNIIPATVDPKGNKMDILDANSPYRPQIFFGNPVSTRIKYNRLFEEIKKCFIPDKNNLNIDFSIFNSPPGTDPAKKEVDDYWNVNMHVNNYETGVYETGRTIELHADFYINLMNTKYKTYTTTGISIVSVPQDKLPGGSAYYVTSNGLTVYIPTIHIRWGCFAAGTKITMANGDKKPVEKIRQQDVLFTTKGPAKVKTVYRGPQKTLLRIHTEGGRILDITDTHPIVLAGGKTVPAKRVRPGQEVMTGNGGTDKVKWVYEWDYKGTVYNFEFEDGKEHVVEANGILAGDFISQNSCKDPIVTPQHMTPQTQSLVEQFSALLNRK